MIHGGRAARRNGITVFVGEDEPEREPRVGFTVRERRSAVRRNRVRRRLRAAAQLCALPHRDVVIRGDGEVAEMEFQELVNVLSKALEAAK